MSKRLSEAIEKNNNTILENMSSLASLAYNYIQYYDEYEFQTLGDPTMLKERMKDIIMKVYNDDIQ